MKGLLKPSIDFCLKTGGSREAVTWHFSTLVGMLLLLCMCALHHLQSWIDRACVLYWWHSSVMLLNTGSWKQIKFCMQVQDGPNFCFCVSCIFCLVPVCDKGLRKNCSIMIVVSRVSHAQSWHQFLTCRLYSKLKNSCLKMVYIPVQNIFYLWHT